MFLFTSSFSIRHAGTDDLIVKYLPVTGEIEVFDETCIGENHPTRRIVAYGRALEKTEESELPLPLPSVAEFDQEFITLSKEEVYRQFADWGLRFSSQCKNIESIQMGERGRT